MCLPAPTLPADPTLDEMRDALAVVLPEQAVFDGWGDAALAAAAAALGLDPGHARLAVPGGAPDMIAAWYGAIDRGLALAFPPDRVAAMKVRDRVRALVLARVALVRPVREAARSALAILAQPRNLPLGLRLGWRAADTMWRLAGDTAVDLNHYTKRATLAAVYGATLLVALDDASADGTDTAAFLDRRLAEVMRFERAKAQFRGDPQRRFSLTRFAGRLRYPVR